MGKELVAVEIHRRSRRSSGPLLIQNMAEINEELAASILFGHKRGAFTGAYEDRLGLFQAADRGTLVLDEITETPLSVQATLLRTVERGRIRIVGDVREIEVDVRVIATSNRDVRDAIRSGIFRSDLYYRLASVQIHIPPLRERVEDIPLLVKYFIEELNRREGFGVLGVDEEVMDVLKRRKWEGNVRELKNLVESLAIKKKEGWIGMRDLRGMLSVRRRRRHLSEEEVREALRKAGGNKSEAARMLGVYRQQIQRLVKKYGLDKEKW
ncbi:sigma-54-dependent Fis family transcriptional regulator [Candidatus Poribacteria bacterium]|nr:sigma-54-dependent Fis family transcriptional regulator [Candidatus Poribacteria bacterium]